ncbi:MAG: RNA 3'-terminal phosphate cyclase [Anaerolineae bacterium]|nr:RNA 3'-terminal phosphate cyclase [Anaerolineae bacterium]
MHNSLVVIDGSYGEGGGQVLRTSLTLSILTGRPVRIEHIRAGREEPGLRPQHLTAVQAAATICGARVAGAELGSQTLTFAPAGPARPGHYAFDVTEVARAGSAGSVSLVLQTILQPLALARGESHLTLRGGTHVPWAPSVFYLEHVFLPQLTAMGVEVRIELKQWGFYPAGGGEIEVHIVGHEGPLRPLHLVERGPLQQVWGIAAVMNLPAHIPQRMADRARSVLTAAGLPGHQVRLEPRRLSGTGPGAGIFLCAVYAGGRAGFTAYGRKGLPAERVAEEACEQFLHYHRTPAPADPHLADQLVLPAALAAGESRVYTAQVSQHLLTNAWVVRQFLERQVVVEGELGVPGVLIVTEGRE